MALGIGVLGAGHLGKIHMRCLRALPECFELKGFYDPDAQQAKHVSDLFGLTAYGSMEELLDEVEVVDIVTPTVAHFSCAEAAIRRMRHVFIEKPLTQTLEEGRLLMQLAREAGIKVQVGHVERFNPAFQAIQPHLKQPRFIEAHRLSLFNPRGTDVSIVLDLMIHDIDVLLSVVGDGIRKISASGVCIVSPTPDIANARIEFYNGCVANLTASRLSMKNMRKMRDITASLVRINSIENHADDIFDHAVAGLFANEKDAVKIIMQKEILHGLETATDKCEDAANVIESIIIKMA